MNILLLQLKRIGDLVLTTPVISALREKFPDAVVTLVVSHDSAALLSAIPNIDKAFVVQRKWSDVKIFRAIWKQKFDYCIDLTRNDRSALFTLLSRARKRVMSDRIALHSRLLALAYNELVDCSTDDVHTIDFNLAHLRPLGIEGASTAIRLDLPADAIEKAEATRRSYKIDKPFVIFHPGSARVEKFWEAQRWVEAIEHARTVLKLNPVLTSGDSALEQQHAAEIKSKLSNPIVDLAGKLDLLTLAALIQQARMLVTVDSAPMHLAAAVQTPQVVLFGPTNPFHWRPRESSALILQGRSTSPLREFSPKQDRVPMKDISTEAVINAMNAQLSAPAAQAS
jgi:predicted lipopolysaccharide heptosyltransferase III